MLSTIEQKLLDDRQSDLGWKLVETFSVTRREHPDEVCEGGQILAQAIQNAGLPLNVYEPSLYLGLPIKADVRVGEQTYYAKAAAGSPSLSETQAELVYLEPKKNVGRLHTNDPAKLFEGDYDDAKLAAAVAGKVVLTGGLSNPGRSELLERMGALAIITINPGEFVHWGASSTVWGNPGSDDLQRLPKIPSIAVNQSSGTQLIEAARDNLPVTVCVEALSGWFKQPIPEVCIQGREPGDEFVLVHGHYDAWDVGVGDNATGNAVLLELARVLQKNPPRRTVKIVWWPGHSAGRYAGSTWYADEFAHELHAYCVGHLNVDSPGCRDATDYTSLRGMVEARALVVDTVKDLFDQVATLDRPGRVGDYSFSNIGVSGAMLTSSMVPQAERTARGWYSVGGNGGSPTWHTEFDQLEIADRGVIENDTGLYALLVWRIAEPQVVAFDYRIPLAEIVEHIERDAQAAQGIVPLHSVLEAAKTLQVGVAALYDEGRISSLPPAKLHAMRRAVARHLVRIGYTVGGAFVHDPALAQPYVPLLDKARHPLAHDLAAQTTLKRGANTLLHELDLALDALNAAEGAHESA